MCNSNCNGGYTGIVSNECDAKYNSEPPIPTDDPWRHRSIGMRCRKCMWFVVKETGIRKDDGRGALGRCRKHAPTMNGFPAVFAEDWCGDHKLDETKL